MTGVRPSKLLFLLAVLGVLLPAAGAPAAADGRQVRGGTRTSVNHSAHVHRNTNVSRNTNVNVNRNVNVHRDIDIDVDHGWDNDWDDHPVARGVAFGTAAALTAAAIGSIVYSLPPSCTTMVVNGLAYQQCGSTWYQPQYAGSQVTYVVVNAPH